MNEFCPTFWTTLILAISKNIIDNRATSKLTKTISKSLLTLSVKAINCKAKQNTYSTQCGRYEMCENDHYVLLVKTWILLLTKLHAKLIFTKYYVRLLRDVTIKHEMYWFSYPLK